MGILWEVGRFDLKGKAISERQAKYYSEDLGLRSASSGFRGMDLEPHGMENVLYNELVGREYSTNVGGVISSNELVNGKQTRVNHEVEFGRNGQKPFYIHSAFYLSDEEETQREKRPSTGFGMGFRAS